MKARLKMTGSHIVGIYQKHRMPVFLFLMSVFFTECSRTGMYSIIVSNPGIQHEQNDLNDLGNPYKKKKIIFPSSVVLMSQAEKERWLDTLSQYRMHTIDTTLKISLIKTPGLAELKIPACGKEGVAIIMLKSLSTRRGGKLIDIQMCYVCKNDNPDIQWDHPGKYWAATPAYKIDVMDPCNECYDGFHSIEFQFAPEKETPLLRSVLVICAKE
jgi:hypothetical protein